jgi:hypothetical protein
MKETSSGGFLSFRAVVQGQSYLNILYNILAFPLSLFYFVFVIVGLSVGLGLVVVWVGVPLLVGTLAASNGFSAFERILANNMLAAEIPSAPPAEESASLWSRVKALLASSETWGGVLYLLIKFPLGTFSFSLAVALISASAGLIATPILAYLPGVQYPWYFGDWAASAWNTPIALAAAAVLGILLAFLSIHILNGVASLHIRLARSLIGRRPNE